MAVDMFLKIDGVEGESRDAKHKGEIDLLSFSWGITNSGRSSGGGGGAGKVTPGDFSIVKALDKATPQLFERCCEGTHVPAVQLTLSTTSGKETQQEYLKIKLTDVLISSYQTGGSSGGGGIPVESLSFSFNSVEISAADRKGNFVSQVNCNFGSRDGGGIAHEHD